MKSHLFSTAAVILLSAVSGALTAEESNLRGAAASISEDYFDLEDYELDSADEEEGFLADPCGDNRTNRLCRSNPRCEVTRDGSCRQKLDICTGLSRNECNSRDRRNNCLFVQHRGEVGFCERKASCDRKNREQCNDASPDCRWDSGGCVRKHEGRSSGPKGPCEDMSERQCDRAKHCMTSTVGGSRDCVPNLLGELLDTEGMKED
mmetsp:Transcript_11752/g.20097  ORF Transcript_11752/g.20097 Transcript_11752/m.20097 type:complete len:206 (+) Transcript_11752:73-690(+)